MTEYELLKKALASVRKTTDFKPRVALILGSGLGGFADNIERCGEIEYTSIDGFPVSTVPGHKGRYIFGYIGEVPVVCMQGRVHYYEGYSMKQVVMPVRLMGLMGAETLFLTNASGGINPDFYAGALMVIKGHISSFVPSPLIGANIDEFGQRFPDMTKVYDPVLSDIIEETAKEKEIPVKSGIYCQLGGPNFETPEEIKMLRILGADAVGMSSACEAIAARHMGLRICGISCVTNLAAGMTGEPLTHEEVIASANDSAHNMTNLLTGSIIKM